MNEKKDFIEVNNEIFIFGESWSGDVEDAMITFRSKLCEKVIHIKPYLFDKILHQIDSLLKKRSLSVKISIIKTLCEIYEKHERNNPIEKEESDKILKRIKDVFLEIENEPIV